MAFSGISYDKVDGLSIRASKSVRTKDVQKVVRLAH